MGPKARRYPSLFMIGLVLLAAGSVGAGLAQGASDHTAATSLPGDDAAGHADDERAVPHVAASAPFVAILLAIAILPLIPRTAHWWHRNRNKLLVSAALGAATLAYYGLRGFGVGHGAHLSPPGVPTVLAALRHAVLAEYLPFIVLLFSLYTICGGIQLKGDLRATPRTNTCFLGVGAVLASVVGTTGAAMLLIRPLLQTNQERHHVKHTVIFFIFLVANIGGSLLPIGDPPLFLGYLRGVPFLWTLALWPPWLFTVCLLLAVYYVWDTRMYQRELPADRLADRRRIEPLRIRGTLNFLWLAGVVLSVALLVPGQKLTGTDWIVPDCIPGPREAAQLLLVGLAWLTGARQVRSENRFDFSAIIEVAVLFIGIFVCMQVPVEILTLRGRELGLSSPIHFFWATGSLSSFLDNAPTYVVFFETAKSLGVPAGTPGVAGVAEHLLAAVSLGAVFMGSMTYIGNGPNFMVKTIAEQAAVPMPSFFGYMAYSVAVLIPTFALMVLLFLRAF